MRWTSEEILAILDQCAAAFTFPMLDNGYVYLAASRLSLHRTETDWGMVIEVFGYSPRAGLPDAHIHTFASSLYNRDSPEQYKSRSAYENYLANHPYNESRFVFPISSEDWKDTESCDYIAEGSTTVQMRGRALTLPPLEEYGQHGIELESLPRIHVFELCRFLADIDRESVLSNSDERRISLPPEMNQILQLEEWKHPNLVEGEVPSQSETFQQLVQVLITGDCDRYRPSQPPNTHWKNWPDGGSL
jgi:hypothetical protein